MKNKSIVQPRTLPATTDKRPICNTILHCPPIRQSGAVLIISLIMLLLLTLIGVTGMQTASLQEKMASNMRDKDLAFQAAESALKDVENKLSAFVNPPAPAVPPVPTPDASNTTGFYTDISTDPATIPTVTTILTDSFWTTNPVATSAVTGLGNGIAAPVYIIQQLPPACFTPTCPPNLLSPTFRITVRATGGSTNAVVILQSIYSLP